MNNQANINQLNPIIERWQSIVLHIEKLQQQSNLAINPVRLIAVSKAQEAKTVMPLVEAGHRDFGENRVQEAQDKWPPLLERFPSVRLHLIGSLQTNKVKEALALFHTIQTIDRESLVDAIVKHRDTSMRTAEFFIQVNTGEESQKGGVSPKSVFSLLNYCREAQLAVTGLMCVPPAGEIPAPHFALLYKIAHEFGLPHLSMGMSGDYETAIRLGATHVRIGTALFGARV